MTFSFSVIAPFSGDHEAQTVPFHWRMVQDGVAWFGEYTTEQGVTIISNSQSPEGDAPDVNPFPDLFASRIAVQHRTGKPGEDLLSGNYNWGVGLISLAGRAGLDLNLGLSYNSLAAWTKVNPPQAGPDSKLPQTTSFTFDADRGFPSVGFRMGFPTIQGPFSNSQTSGSSYLVLMPSGARVKFRQVSSTNVYEAADSSYSQLLDGGNGSLLMRTTDGSQLAYWSINSEYRCTEVKDRNGNYLTIKYDPINGTANLGRITSITDTLGRTLNFNYDANYRLQSISQPRNGQTPHVWATFGYTDKPIETNFNDSVHGVGQEEQMEPVATQRSEQPILGLPEDHLVSVLTQVGLDDGSRYTFDYTSWGQVYRIKHFAADGHQLNFTSYNLPLDASTAQTDCPRFSQRQDGVENWNNNSAAFTNFEIDLNGMWGQVTTAVGTADQVTYKEYSTTQYTDWRRGLLTRTEIYTPESTTPKKTTITDWTQDDPNLAYPLNPRVTTATISDAEGKRRRTTIEYTAFGLPSDVYEMEPYETNDWRTLRRTHTDYNLSDAYVNRRIIGLVAGQYLFAPDAPNSSSIQTLMGKTTMEYDVNAICSGPCYTLGPEVPSAPIDPVVHHDSNYGAGFTVGRGLLAKVNRWDAFDEMNGSKMTTSSLVYNVYGSLIRSVDPRLHTTQIHYTDSFSNDGIGSNPAPYVTMAYPTLIRDGDGYYSSARYSYDLGAVTRQQDPKGAAQTTEYDSADRVKRVTNAVNGAYTRFVYSTSQTIVNKFTTIQEGEGEAYSATVFDGAGRVRAVAGDFPNSTGHYSGQFTLYDQQGRAVQSTNPTEMTHGWAAAGDDAIGWYSTSQTYDWKGRPLVTINPSITSDPNETTTRTASYGGCGCAGGAVVTLTDEGTIEAGILKRRQQKIYSDPLGRTIKTEALNWQGGGVYSATVNTYNARDQVTLVRQYQGPDTSATHEDTTITYDGFGRPKTQHVPSQKVDPMNPFSTDHTTWDYYDDDTLTDSRGAMATFTYNARQLVRTTSYNAPAGSNVAQTAAVEFDYDQAGNRLWMTDSQGRVDYLYDTLSRLTSETRQFNGVPRSHAISYSYNLAGQLTSITNPFNQVTTYDRDNVGRLIAIGASGYRYENYDAEGHLTGHSEVPQIATNFAYRATGSVKHLTYANAVNLDYHYNNRLQLSQFSAANTVENIMAADYQYYGDGRLKLSHDLVDARFDRAYNYDQVGRVSLGLTGSAARNEPMTDANPYHETYQYDAWNNLVGRTSKHWSRDLPSYSATYTDDRNQDSSWQYDAEGNVVASGTQGFTQVGNTIYPYDWRRSFTFDAEGRPTTEWIAALFQTSTTAYDGDGQSVRTTNPHTPDVAYYVRSTVMEGQLVCIVGSAGQKLRSYIYGDYGLLAESIFDAVFLWQHIKPLNGSVIKTNHLGLRFGRDELDPLRGSVGEQDPYENGEGASGGTGGGNIVNESGNMENMDMGCVLDGINIPCGIAMRFVNSGAAAPCPNNDCGPVWNPNRDGLGHPGWQLFAPTLDPDEGDWVNFGPLGKGSSDAGLIPSDVLIASMDRDFAGLSAGQKGRKTRRDPSTKQRRIRPESVPGQAGTRTGGKTPIQQNLAIEGFNARQESWIRFESKKLVSPNCDAAYSVGRYSLRSPRTIMETGGVVIRHADVLTSSSAADLGLSPESFRKAQTQAYLGQGQSGVGIDGRRHIFLNNKAFLGPSLAKGFNSLSEVLNHEFIHDGLDSWPDPIWGEGRHDLAGFPNYDHIIEVCR